MVPIGVLGAMESGLAVASGKPTLEESIAAVCRMPVDYRIRGNASWFALAQESGYVLHREEVSETRLEAHVRAHPELLDAWVGYSEDQRWSPAWWIRPPDPDEGRIAWTVGYLDRPPSTSNPIHTFGDPMQACGFFIKRQLEQVTSSQNRLPPFRGYK